MWFTRKRNEVIIIDNLDNSYTQVLSSINLISKKDPIFYKGNLGNKNFLHKIFSDHNIVSIIHFAGYKSVSESILNPLNYYYNNVVNFITLLKLAKLFNVKNFIFSSSATVYGETSKIPYNEKEKNLSPSNPYGNSKLFIEKILIDEFKNNKDLNIAILRYFNPAGAHNSGLLGENPKKINKFNAALVDVALNKKPILNIYGNSYDTSDGTCVRDFIHVTDLSKGHISALEYIKKVGGFEIINLGSGKGFSVLEVVKTFENINQVKIPVEFKQNRAGDLPSFYADINKAKQLLGWYPKLNLSNICEDIWKFKKNNI